ncbi:MAG: hypothetical protein QM500_09200 [Methylococcales bacterium]
MESDKLKNNSTALFRLAFNGNPVSSILMIIFICGMALPLSANEIQKAQQFEAEKKYNKATYFYIKALNKNNYDTVALYGLANSSYKTGNLTRALDKINHYLQIQADENGMLLRAKINLKRNDWQAVVVDTLNITHMNSNNAQAFLYMDNAYTALGNKVEAEMAMEKYKALTQGNAVETGNTL